jgi:hypothetical protein
MTQNRSHKIKKSYQSPLIVEVGIDNYITLDGPSTDPPGDPTTTSAYSEEDEKELFPDTPTTDDPFGGSSPNYR